MVMSYKRYSAEDVVRILTEDTEIPEISLEEVTRIVTEDTEIPEISNPGEFRSLFYDGNESDDDIHIQKDIDSTQDPIKPTRNAIQKNLDVVAVVDVRTKEDNINVEELVDGMDVYLTFKKKKIFRANYEQTTKKHNCAWDRP